MQRSKLSWWLAATLLTPVLSIGQEPAGPPVERQSRFGPRPEGFGPIVFALSEALDGNRDGRLSAEEIEQAAASLKTLDKDGDGRLSAEEIGWPPRRAGGPGGPFPFGGPPGEGGRARTSMAQRVMSRDTNDDGRVTAEELPRSMQFLLRLGDANADRAIDVQEAEQLFRRLGLDSATAGGNSNTAAGKAR